MGWESHDAAQSKCRLRSAAGVDALRHARVPDATRASKRCVKCERSSHTVRPAPWELHGTPTKAANALVHKPLPTAGQVDARPPMVREHLGGNPLDVLRLNPTEVGARLDLDWPP